MVFTVLVVATSPSVLAATQSNTVTLSVFVDTKTATQTFSVAPPFTVTLTAAGDSTDNNVTLTATTNYAVDGNTLSILDQTTGKVIASILQWLIRGE